MKMQSELNNFRNASRVYNRNRFAIEQPKPQPKRKFNLMLGLKRCFDDFNEYMGIETTADKIFYHTYFWSTVVILVFVIRMSNKILGME